MITFNNIVERFEVFATNHFFIKSFSFGSPDDVDLAKFTEFPLMHMVYTGATYDTGTKTYNIEVYILDVPADKTDKVERQREVVSDAEQCAEDIIADIRMGGNIFTFAQDYEVVNATTTPLEEETKNVLSGVLLDLSVEIPYEWDACNAPIDGVIPGGGDVPSYARRGFLRMLTLDGTTDVLSVRTINVTNGTLTDDGDGVVTLNTGGAETLEDLTDVNIISPEQGDVLSYNSGVQKWMKNGGLQELLARFKASGSGAQMYDTLNDTTKGYIDILANSAKMKVNLSGLTVTEASPGVMSFAVAAGTEGNEVEFEAMTIEGSDALSTIAEINFKQGALTYWENATGKIWLRAPNAGNITVLLPSSTGTLALTTDIPNVPVDSVNGQTGVVVLDTGDIDENGNLYYTEARVAANAAVVANTAKVGITPTQASEITANTAKVGITTQQANDITANNAKTGITPTQAGEITANTAKVGVIAGGTLGQALVKASGTDYDTEWADIAIDTQYHDRFATDAETFRSGATDTLELYYTAKADGDGLAEDAESDTPTAGKVIKRKIYYSEAAFADPDTGTWVEFTTLADDITFANAKAALLEYLKARTGGTVPISLKQTWEEVTAAPAFTGLLNETYGSGAEAAYSTRRLNGLYSGDCMTIRRASDSTTQSIGFVGEEIDESAIETFCSGTTCTIQVWFDQSGNGNNATQTEATKQPTIYTGGQLVKEGGRLALDFDGSNDHLNFTQIDLTSDCLIAHIATHSAADSAYGGPTGNFGAYQATTTTLRWRFSGATYYATVPTITAGDQYLSLFRRESGTANMSYDGADTTSQSLSGTGSFSVLGASTQTSHNLLGKAQEYIFYTSAKTSQNRTDIEGNISAYFQSAKLLDEQFGEGAEAAYSTRQLRRDQTECMVIRRASDSTTTTIGFDGSGNISEADIETFCTGTTCTVYTWKDQSGNGNDATAAAPANEPTIYTGGAIVKDGGRVAFTSTSSTSFSFTQISNINSVFSVLRPTDFTNNNSSFILGASSNYNYHSGISGKWLNTTNAIQAVWDGANYLNGTAVTLDTTTRSAGQYVLSMIHTSNTVIAGRISEDRTFGRSWVGNRQELIIYSDDRTNNRTSIEENIGDYFTQNTPLLDTYSGAAAAYSLRRLSSSYTGDAVEVYNGSSYADIGFNVFGELDTLALAAHCGSNSGYVSKWYSQTGSNDATQTVTGSMPKIYDGTTGVVTDNGKPAVEFNGTSTEISAPTVGLSVATCFIHHTNFDATARMFGQFDRFENSFFYDRVTGYWAFNNGGINLSGLPSTTSKLVYAVFDNTGGELGINGATATSGTLGVISGQMDLRIGRRASSYWKGTASELIVYDSDESANRTNIETNINTFYSIY